MTPRYFYWLAMQAERDAALSRLALIALGLVIAWEFLYLAPPALSKFLRPIYLFGGAILYLSGIGIVYVNRGGL